MHEVRPWNLDAVIRAMSVRAEELSFAEFCGAHRAWLRLRDSVADATSTRWVEPPEWNALPRSHPRVSYGAEAIEDFVRVAAGKVVCIWEEGARGGWRAQVAFERDRFEIASIGLDAYVLDVGHRWVFALTLDSVSQSQAQGPFFVSAPDEPSGE